VIGDSLGVGTEPYLETALAGVDVSTDARTSRTSSQGLAVLAEEIAPADEVVVFALGTNDDPAAPQVLADNLARAASIADGRCLVVATVARPPLNGVTDTGLNAAIRAFASAAPDVRLVEWENAVAAEPGMLSDGVHATPDGYALRASLFADAIASCDTSPQAGGGDGIPNPDHDALAEGRSRPGAGEAAKQPRSLSRQEAFDLLADALASQVAIGALQ
jgi:lysophospholipase L1-like esterase